MPLANVLHVLRKWKVGVSPDKENPGGYLFVKGKIAESKVLPACVSRKMLQYLQHKFGIWIHHFYHPVMADKMLNVPSADKPS